MIVLITDATGIKGSLPEDVQRLLTGRMEFIAGIRWPAVKAAVLVCPRPRFFDGANYIVVPAAFKQLVGRSNG